MNCAVFIVLLMADTWHAKTLEKTLDASACFGGLCERNVQVCLDHWQEDSEAVDRPKGEDVIPFKLSQAICWSPVARSTQRPAAEERRLLGAPSIG